MYIFIALCLWLIPASALTVQLMLGNQPVISESVIAESETGVIVAITDADGYARFHQLNTGQWRITACTQQIEYISSEGATGSLLLVACDSIVYLPFIYR
jgi:hypothetical protein